MQSDLMSSNRTRMMDMVPPLVQMVSNLNGLTNSPINTLNNSIVSSQYIFDNNSVQKASTQNPPKLLKKQLKTTKLSDNNSYHKKTQNQAPSIKKQGASQVYYEAKQLQKYETLSQKSYHQVIQLQPILNDSSFQRGLEQSVKEEVRPKQSDLFYETCQIFKNMVNSQRSTLQTEWLESSPKQILCTIMTNPTKLIFFLQNIQNLIIQRRDIKIKSDLELLSCMLFKLLSQKNKNNQKIKPQIYLHQNGLRIDFQPSNDTKAKQRKIDHLRQINLMKEKQIQKIRRQYDEIVHNLATVIDSINQNNNKNNNNRVSIQKSKKSNSSLRLMRKATFGYHKEPSDSSKDQDYQYM